MTPWVLLRGLTRESRHWGAFPQTLARQFPQARVLAPDLAGNGRLHTVPSPSTVQGMAADCRARLLAAGERPPFRLLAMSLGAMVAVAWAKQHPGDVEACVLINTSLRPFSPFYQRLRPRNYAALLKLALGRGDECQSEARVLAMTSRLASPDPALLAQWVSFRRECPVSAGNALRQLWAAARCRADAARPLPPVLVLTSARDGLVDTRCSQRLALHWAAPIAVHPWAGHDLALDDGAWVAAQVCGWLQRIGPESAYPPLPTAPE